MYLISGATGNTGSAAADKLLALGHPVTVLVRDARKGESWKAKGAKVAVGSLDDAQSLTAALAGVDGAYLLIPPQTGAPDYLAYSGGVARSLAAAVKASGVPHVVLVSSIGAQRPAGTGPIVGLHRAEALLGEAARNFTILRNAYFLDNWAPGVQSAREQGVLHNFLTPDTAMPMVSTTDIGRMGAELLLKPPAGKRIIELTGPEDYSPIDIADAFSTALGKRVELLTHPIEAVVPALTAAGLGASLAALTREMIEAVNAGELTFEGPPAEFRRGTVTALEAVRSMLGLTAH